MFAGRRRRSSNIRVMQLFHELKQQFPTVPDHVVTACIATHAQQPSSDNQSNKIREILEAAAIALQQEPMGRSPQVHTTTPPITPVLNDTPLLLEEQRLIDERNNRLFEMNDSDAAARSDLNNVVTQQENCVTFSKKFEKVSVCHQANEHVQTGNSRFYVKRPNYLDIKPDGGAGSKFSFINNNQLATSGVNQNYTATASSQNNIQLSEKCKDVYKLLHSENLSDKPPRSPLSNKRLTNKISPTKCEHSTRSPSEPPKRLPPTPTSPLFYEEQQRQPAAKKKETASTPTQTTDTLLGNPSGNVSPATSVNLSLNVNCSMDLVQSPTRRSSVLQVTPHQPWLQQEPSSPRSYTSVNLTLRPPSSEPQAPIDITSRNSSLTYSTSSFDSQKGLQSRLQITVGPGGGGSVSSVRTRPRSSYYPQGGEDALVVPVRQAGSLNNLAASSEPPVILKQEARLEKLRIELRTDKARLQIMQSEIAELEDNNNQQNQKHAIEQKVDDEFEKQLKREIKHLQYQCEQLAQEGDKNENFYQNLYTGQRGSLSLEFPSTRITQQDGWNCSLCTFRNHPDLDECEQCQCHRIVHGKRSSNPEIYFNDFFQPLLSPHNRVVPSQSLPNFANNNDTSPSGQRDCRLRVFSRDKPENLLKPP